MPSTARSAIDAHRPVDVLCPHPKDGMWSFAWHLLFYGGLVLGLAGAFLDHAAASPLRLGTIASATVALGIWYWLWVGRGALTSAAARAAYFVVAGALWTALVSLEPAYEFVAFSAFIQLTGYLSWRSAAPAIVALVAIMELHPVARGESVDINDLIGGVITLAIAAMAILPMRAIHAESERRRRLIVELDHTRRELSVAEREAGMLQERERLAGAMHDTVAQGLSSIVMLLEAAQASLGSASPGTSSHIEQALRAARENLREVRRLVWALRPEPLEHGTLIEALRRLAQSEGGFDVTVVINGNVRRLTTDAEVTLLRAAQELLSNIRRHAAASSASLVLTYGDDEVVLEARDDGKGIDASAMTRRPTRDGGLGLVMMRERVEALGGSLHIGSRLARGAAVTIELPAGPAASHRPNEVQTS